MPGRRMLTPARVTVMAVVLAATTVVVSSCSPWIGTGGVARISTRSGAPYSLGVVGNGFGPKLTTLDHGRPTVVPGIRGRVIQIATSNSDSYALTSSGAVWAWGAGSTGELGDGSRPVSAAAPVKVAIPAGVRIIALANPMPYDSALAVDATGHVWGWGFNVDNALCLPRRIALTPTRLPLSGVTLATGAGDHSLFYAGGRVYACGLGVDGELGDRSIAPDARPSPVVGLPAGRVAALVSSWQGSGALMANGAYYDWGFNRAGQLGDGLRANSDVPVRVPLPAPVRQVSQGGSRPTNGQTLALLRNGTVWAWGSGSLGQLGGGSRRSSPRPKRVTFPKGVRIESVCSGGDSSYALGATGTLWTWGGNDFGQLGTGGTRVLVRPAPLAVSWAQVSATATNVAGLGRSS